jgi:carbonic anhydrase
MSELCKDATAPINITLSDDDKNNKKCDQKCNYICNYKITSSVMTNKEDSIKLTYDNLNSPPVTYNGVKYNVQEMRIFSPSIHTWDESTVSAELIILHSPVEGQTANNLSVSIPIKSSTTTVPSSLGSIISQMNQTGQQSGSRTHLASLDLKDYVPFNAPFFSYNGSLIFDKCRGDENEYVVLDPENSGYKTISEADLTALQKLIQASTITVKANNASITN